MRILAVITDPDEVKKILRHLIGVGALASVGTHLCLSGVLCGFSGGCMLMLQDDFIMDIKCNGEFGELSSFLSLQWARLAKAAGRVVFSGMGASEFAPESILTGLAGSGIDASTIDTGEWLHYPRPVDDVARRKGVTAGVFRHGGRITSRE